MIRKGAKGGLARPESPSKCVSGSPLELSARNHVPSKAEVRAGAEYFSSLLRLVTSTKKFAA